MYGIISKILDVILVKMAKSLYVIGKISKDSKYVVTCTHESYNRSDYVRYGIMQTKFTIWLKRAISNKWGGKF